MQARRRRADDYRACGALDAFRAVRSTRTLDGTKPMRHGQEVLAFAALGCVPPIVFITYHGLQNEGWDSLGFLFYPGPETFLTAVLLLALFALSFTHLPNAARRLRSVALQSPAAALGAFAIGLLVAATLLWLLGHDELTMRKFYTYLVAPRAFTILLAIALPLLVLLGRRPDRG